jgi:hypothetical protein
MLPEQVFATCLAPLAWQCLAMSGNVCSLFGAVPASKNRGCCCQNRGQFGEQDVRSTEVTAKVAREGSFGRRREVQLDR